MKKIFPVMLLVAVLFSVAIFIAFSNRQTNPADIEKTQILKENTTAESNSAAEGQQSNPLAIESLRQIDFPKGQFEAENALANTSSYKQLIVSYMSEGLKIYGLLTVPLSEKPEGGFPAIVFVHGYIPPTQYSTTGSYPTYQAALARAGFVTFKPDLRGHGKSEGNPVSAHFSEKYVVDTMNAIAHLKEYPDINPQRIGYWGHSNGGEIGLRVIEISPDIKAASLWAGVVGSPKHMFETYNDKIPFLQDIQENDLIKQYGLPSQNTEFWKKLDPYEYLDSISIPLQLQHATGDESVPVELSRQLRDAMEKLGKDVEYFEYQGDDHNISKNSSRAFGRDIEFYRKNL